MRSSDTLRVPAGSTQVQVKAILQQCNLESTITTLVSWFPQRLHGSTSTKRLSHHIDYKRQGPASLLHALCCGGLGTHPGNPKHEPKIRLQNISNRSQISFVVCIFETPARATLLILTAPLPSPTHPNTSPSLFLQEETSCCLHCCVRTRGSVIT